MITIFAIVLGFGLVTAVMGAADRVASRRVVALTRQRP
jgi:hypothetical protein